MGKVGKSLFISREGPSIFLSSFLFSGNDQRKALAFAGFTPNLIRSINYNNVLGSLAAAFPESLLWQTEIAALQPPLYGPLLQVAANVRVIFA